MSPPPVSPLPRTKRSSHGQAENEVVIWDRIVTSPAKAKISLKNQTPKYKIHDITHRIAARENVTLAVRWNVQPHVGVLGWGAKGVSGPFALPEVAQRKASGGGGRG